jgi:hypothetical protein
MCYQIDAACAGANCADNLRDAVYPNIGIPKLRSLQLAKISNNFFLINEDKTLWT